MLIKNVNGVSKVASMLKNSEFYIEVAKFVQAYTTIVTNPNEFLKEINMQLIDEKKDKLTWAQFVNIMQNCDLGFTETPTATELLVYYNYAIEIGTINAKHQKLATVDDVADAQKHYYNFIYESKDRAESKYLRQKRITEMRESESAVIDNQLSKLKAGNLTCLIVMMFACLMGGFGLVSLFFSNSLVYGISSIFGFNNRYVGAVVLVAIAIIIFSIFDKFYLKTKSNYIKLNIASETIFARSDETYATEQILKRKYNEIKKNFDIIQAEINDETKKYDVKHNIEALKSTNKFYQKLCPVEMSSDLQVSQNLESPTQTTDDQQEFAPVKLTTEQELNLAGEKLQTINLEGQFDVDAYNEKFEKSTKSPKKKEEAEIKAKEKQEEQEKIQQQQEIKENTELLDSIDFIKNVLGFGEKEEDLQQQK